MAQFLFLVGFVNGGWALTDARRAGAGFRLEPDLLGGRVALTVIVRCAEAIFLELEIDDHLGFARNDGLRDGRSITVGCDLNEEGNTGPIVGKWCDFEATVLAGFSVAREYPAPHRGLTCHHLKGRYWLAASCIGHRPSNPDLRIDGDLDGPGLRSGLALCAIRNPVLPT